MPTLKLQQARTILILCARPCRDSMYRAGLCEPAARLPSAWQALCETKGMSGTVLDEWQMVRSNELLYFG